MVMGRREVVKKAYPKFYDEAYVICQDECFNEKYLKWVCIQLENKQKKSNIIKAISEFSEKQTQLPQKDIYQYKTIKDLSSALDKVKESERKLKEKHKNSGTVLLLDNNKYKVLRINSKYAIMLYGKGTRWCITSENDATWEQYNDKGSFYIVINKENNSKIICQKILDGFNINSWKENDYPIDDNISEYIDKEAYISILNDNTPNFIRLMNNFKIKKDDPELIKWLEYQHPTTIYTIKINRPEYFDIKLSERIFTSPEKIIDIISNEDIKYLIKNLKNDNKDIKLRFAISGKFPEFSNIAPKLEKLSVKDLEKYIKYFSYEKIISTMNAVEGQRKSIMLKHLEKNISVAKLLEFAISKTDKLPDEIWT
jgi:hypothetical protein